MPPGCNDKGLTGDPGYAAGVAWSVINAAAGVFLPFAMFIFFARHLAPADVGTIMFASAIGEIVKVFGLLGLYEALLQQPPGNRGFHQTALAALLAAGLGLLIIYIGIMAVIGHMMPALGAHEMVLCVLGLRIVCDLATVQPQAALAQNLAYSRLAVRSVVANCGAGVIGITLALSGQPFIGLVAYLTGQSVLVFLTTATGAGTLARPRFNGHHMATMMPEALTASVVRLVSTANNYLDQIILASNISGLALAYFNLGKRMEMTFITASSSFSGILFQPAFSVQATDARRVALRRGLATLGLVCGVPFVFFVINAQTVVRLAFGPAWVPAAAVAAVLAASGFIRAVGSIHGALLSVSGHNRQLMRVSMVSAGTGIAVVIAGASFGLFPITIGLVLKNILIVAWMAGHTKNSLPNPLMTYVRIIIVPVILMALICFGVAVIARHSLPQGGLWIELAILATSGLATAAGGIVFFGPTIFSSHVNLTRISRRPSSIVAPL